VGRPPNDGNTGRVHSYAMQRCAVQDWSQGDICSRHEVLVLCVPRHSPQCHTQRYRRRSRLSQSAAATTTTTAAICIPTSPSIHPKTFNQSSSPNPSPCPSSDLFGRCGPSAPPVSSPPTPPQPLSPHHQNPPGPTTWSRGQMPKPLAYDGPRFEQTDLSLQPNAPSAMGMVAEDPVRLVHGRKAVCEGGE
jgi:NADH dehydrogenase (ubiquinone) Fe-S protein 6